jgi:hypothetical protein
MPATDRAAYGGGRRQPYTELGILRLPCARAGCTRPAYATWSACADGNLQRPLCPECDVALNVMVLRWFGDPAADTKLAQYAWSVAERAGRPLDLEALP